MLKFRNVAIAVVLLGIIAAIFVMPMDIWITEEAILTCKGLSRQRVIDLLKDEVPKPTSILVNGEIYYDLKYCATRFHGSFYGAASITQERKWSTYPSSRSVLVSRNYKFTCIVERSFFGDVTITGCHIERTVPKD